MGLKARNVVAIAWSQPAAVFDESLLDAILAGIVLTEAPVYSDGDLAPRGWTEFTMSVPVIWGFEEQPTLNGEAMSGVRRLAEGRVLVSFGGSDGAMGWCDPECRQFDDLTTLDALEAAIRSGSGLGPSTSITLDGEPARRMSVDSPVARSVVIAMHDDRPVAVLLDAGEWDVGPGIFDEMIGSFAFADPVKIEPPDQNLTTAGGRVRFGLSDEWKQSDADDGRFVKGINLRMTVRAGDDHGSITTCSNGAGPWDRCREITPTSLDELADAVQPGPLDDHGVGPPTGHRDATTLGGEPAVVTRIHAYEYPARGGQEVVYIVAMHDGRPYIVRIHTREDYVQGLESIIAGFTFVD